MASYVLHVRKAGWAEARIPLVLHRGEQREIHVELVWAEKVPADGRHREIADLELPVVEKPVA